MSKLKPNQLDNYEVEIVEDIPEQFDLSRYKKSKMQNTQQYRAAPPPPPLQSQPSQPQIFAQPQMTGYVTQPQQQNYYPTANPQPQNMFENVYIVNQQNRDYLIEQKNLKPNGGQIINNNLDYSQQSKAATSASMATAPLSKTSNQQDILNSQMNQQFVQYAVNYQGAMKQNYRYPSQQVVQIAPSQSPPQQGTTLQRHPQHPSYMNQGALDNIPQQSKNVQVAYYPSKDYDYQYPPHSTTLKKKSPSSTGTKYSDLDHQITDHDYQPQRTLLHDNSGSNWSSNKLNKNEGRKKNSFDDEDDDNPHQKREYYLKGGDEARDEFKRSNNYDDGRTDPSPHRSSNLIETAIVVPAKSSLKPPKKQGVTFDEKLEVYEVKNPHYGLEAKSEKREIRKKKKDKQKEEELILKTKLDMKLKIQNQNMLHYYVIYFFIIIKN
jgi:hypothetical protein